MKTKLTSLTVVVMLVAGCATMGDPVERQAYDRLTSEQIEASDAQTLYELIQRERPRWLVVRSARTFQPGDQGILVYQDQTRLGGVNVLRDMSPGGVMSLRYLDGATASATLPGIGSGHVHGAIVISTRADR